MGELDESSGEHRERYHIGGLELEIRASGPDVLAGMAAAYRRYPSAGYPPNAVLSIACDPALRRSAAASRYPGFDCRVESPGVMALSRADAAGRIEVPDNPELPVRASFTLAARTTVEAAIRVISSVALPRLGGLLLHASAVAIDGRAYVFTGKSGVGKSTIARLATTGRPAAVLVADEIVLLRRSSHDSGPASWEACVSPFHDIPGLPHGSRFPVHGVHLIEQGAAHERTSVAAADALGRIVPNVLVYAGDRGTAGSVLDACTALVRDLHCFELRFRKSADVVKEVLKPTPAGVAVGV